MLDNKPFWNWIEIDNMAAAQDNPRKVNSLWSIDAIWRQRLVQKLAKSPQSGVTLCFQLVSAASAAATTFASHVKTVRAKP